MRRRLVTLIVVPLMLFGAAACGGDSGNTDSSGSSSGSSSDGASEASDGTGETVDTGKEVPGVNVTGDLGEEPKVTIDAPLKLDTSESAVVLEGDGPEVKDGEDTLLHLYVANGTTGKKGAATFDQGQPAPVTVAEGQIFPSVYDALVGTPAGSRVVVASTPADAYGAQGMPQMKLSGKDPVVFVVDIMSVAPTDVLKAPEGTDAEVPAGLPTIEEKGGNVTKLSFDTAPKTPSADLKVIPLIEGEGPPARANSLVTFDYFGQVYGTDKVFDESFSKEPVTFPLGVGGLIKAWDEGLVGVKQGSRVMIIAPPEFGYGAQGNPQGGIGGKDTLVFVVDVLGVS